MCFGIYRTVSVGDKTLHIKPFNTRIELAVLEFLTFNEYNDDDYECVVDQVLNECVKDYDCGMSKIEKIIALMQLRNITIGDEFNVECTCSVCKKKITKKLMLDDILMNASGVNKHVQHKFISSHSFNVNIDELDLDDVDMNEYEYINEHISDFFTIYNNNIKLSCDCGKTNTVNLFTYRNILNFLSDDTFMSLSSCIRIIVMNNKYSRESVLDMTPVQRMLELKYIKDQMKNE